MILSFVMAASSYRKRSVYTTIVRQRHLSLFEKFYQPVAIGLSGHFGAFGLARGHYEY